MAEAADFSGYATKAGLKCSDGLTIMPNAFEHQDGMQVPLVWQHGQHAPGNILGHAILENRADGVYAHCYFNSSPEALSAKEAVRHKDIDSLSIYANKLIKKTTAVIHGMIREVSLVVAGANPGAKIDNVAVVHGDGETEVLLDEAVITTGLVFDDLSHADADDTEDSDEPDEDVATDTSDDEPTDEGSSDAEDTKEDDEPDEDVSHAESDDETVGDIYNSFDSDQKAVVHYLIGAAIESKKGAKHSDDDDTDEVVSHAASGDKTIGDIYKAFSPKQKDVVHYLVGAALEEADDAVQQSDINNVDEEIVHQEGTEMTQNVFETKASGKPEHTLTHSDLEGIFENAKRLGSVRDAVEAYSLKHGIEDIDVLFPDAKAISSTPELLARRMEWVAVVMDGVRHTPFSRIKSLAANLTLDEARAKGYVKGNLKREEFFKVSKRVTTPQTVYKKQKLDRDDILDITDFDVVAWLKAELRLMLEEEVARAILFGDGRSIGDEDKISEDNIRSIANDDEFYATTIYVNVDDANSSPEEIVDALILQRHHYRGSGNPILFTKEILLAKMLNVKDDLGRRIYSSVTELATVLRVSRIVSVEAMESEEELVGVMVNLADYNVGADRGGQTTMFDDFDIDYNQYKYLLETRFSGALVKPKSAIVVRKAASADVLVEPATPSRAGNVVTVGTQTGVVWTATGPSGAYTITAGAFTILEANEPVEVVAAPASGYYFPSDAYDWMFEYQA